MVNRLWDGDIRTVDDLVQQPDHELLRLDGLGRRTLNEIKEALAATGLCLGMDLNDEDDRRRLRDWERRHTPRRRPIPKSDHAS